jgi:hypothetical protein
MPYNRKIEVAVVGRPPRPMKDSAPSIIDVRYPIHSQAEHRNHHVSRRDERRLFDAQTFLLSDVFVPINSNRTACGIEKTQARFSDLGGAP